ncbi:DNA-3-methyladenine glycosylase I [Estrella lausannensis]|uniref:DNA-3-methyladenine glycosylase n=1 Tax=Estrella lausannensis TaxID=483423 RepID=A0A0H5DS84_9BACT|nr:DNA-3-methyladenine glycosylase I [Estrella lausannensis]CRX39571.1 DNA-3-methyladenine glycosylase [Estrella lausannensis]
MTIDGIDGKKRCFGGKEGQELLANYHDHEWGVPSSDDRHLFEMLILEGAQAGLSFETVLKKREGYRKAFHAFDPKKVATMSDQELEGLTQNPEIVRNRLKIWSARQNAIAFLAIQKEFSSFASYLKKFCPKVSSSKRKKSIKELPTKTEVSDALSKDLKKRGMNFVGSTIMYAYMQAVGLVDDHLQDCHLISGKPK